MLAPPKVVMLPYMYLALHMPTATFSLVWPQVPSIPLQHECCDMSHDHQQLSKMKCTLVVHQDWPFHRERLDVASVAFMHTFSLSYKFTSDFPIRAASSASLSRMSIVTWMYFSSFSRIFMGTTSDLITV